MLLEKGYAGTTGTKGTSLNPCFNGRCSVSDNEQEAQEKAESLNPCFNGRCSVS